MSNRREKTGRTTALGDVPLAEASTAALGDVGTSHSLPEVPGYRILRMVGEGGMGAVFEAEQGTPNRLVALKVIRSGGYVTEEQVRLFRREIESLGRLSHPSIAAIHDAGRTPIGQHYFAMELVQGKPLDQWLREAHSRGSETDVRRLSLELFAEICDAIQYAHQRGVMHRDLKPSNLFVTDRTGSSGVPEIKVLDFGLARITDADVSLMTIASEMGQIRGTLAYMSPEQARGNPDMIDLRTDIYSLGIILYEFLTSERPYDVRRKLVPEAVRVILEEEPRRPSTVTKTLRGDLETITLKALEKDPDRRYASVSALSEDVRRYLSGQTILARPQSTMYQVRKLVARHRVPVAFLVTIFVLLVAATVTMSFLYEGQRRERARAQKESLTAERTSTFLRDMLSSIAPDEAQGREVTVREVLDEAAGTIAEELAGEPEVRAQIETTIGVIYGAVGRNEEARAHLNAALDTQRALFGEDDWRTAETKLFLADRVRDAGDVVGSVTLAREAVDTCRRAGRPAIPTLLNGLGQLGMFLGDSGLTHEAAATAREALQVSRKIHEGDHPDVAAALQQLGLRLTLLDEADSAEVQIRASVDMWRRLGDGFETQLGDALGRLAYSYNWIDRYDLAERTNLQALELNHRVHGDNHPSAALIYHNLAVNRINLDDTDGAVAYSRSALGIAEVVYEDNHVQLGVYRIQLGQFLAAQGNFEEAKILFRKGYEPFRDQSHHLAWWPLSALVDACLATDDPIEAESAARRALAAIDGWAPSDHWVLGAARIQLGFCLGMQERFAEAELHMVEGDSLLTAATSDWAVVTSSQDRDWQQQALKRLADFYEAYGRPERAQQYRDRLASAAENP